MLIISQETTYNRAVISSDQKSPVILAVLSITHIFKWILSTIESALFFYSFMIGLNTTSIQKTLELPAYKISSIVMDHPGRSWIEEYSIVLKNTANICTGILLNVDNLRPICG